jgi:hypothetical protein
MKILTAIGKERHDIVNSLELGGARRPGNRLPFSAHAIWPVAGGA